MDRDDFKRIDGLFQEVLAQAPEERERFLSASGAPDALLARVRRLLAHEDPARERIGDAPQAGTAELLTTMSDGTEDFAPGSQLGPYRIVEELGRGGMGTVYLAERSDDRYQRQVALKVVKRGTDTREVLERFRREARILARLEHPGIGRMYDGAVTPDGRPYLVLEYIEGEPIDAYCDGRRLTVEARIRLFLRVCEAVSFAHQKLVLHRDLKPSNILVSKDGPRLLDFGIGKLLDGDDDDRRLTALVGRRLTPEYASPEQAEGAPISTASDVYALGVVLHELLVGRRPGRAEPQRPSTGVTDGQGDVARGRAAARGSTTERLTRRLRGDLDVILMKALREDPGRRYPSVDAFAKDLERHLDGFPVTARPDSLGYRVGKFVRRNRLPVLSGSGLGISVLFFAVATAFQQTQTARERDRAEQERANAEEVASVLEELFTGAGFTSRERIDTLTVRAFLDRSARRVVDDLDSQPVVQATLLRVLGNAQQEFGHVDEADSLLSRAVRLLAPLAEQEADALFDARIALANLHVRRGRWPEARETFRAALDGYRGAPREAAATAYHGLGLTLVNIGHPDSAAAALDTTLAIQRAMGQTDPMAYGASLTLRAGIAQRLGDLEQATEWSREAWALTREELGADHPTTFAYEQNHAFIRYRAGDPEGAEPMFASLVERYRADAGETPDLAVLLLNHGNVLRALGRAEESLQRIEEALDLEAGFLRPDNPQRTFTLDALGATLETLGRYEEAARAYREGLDISEGAFGPGHPSTAGFLGKLASSQCQSGAAATEVVASLERAETAADKAFAPGHRALTDLQVRMGRCFLLLGRSADARIALERALAGLESVRASDEAMGEVRELLRRASESGAGAPG